MKKIRLLSLAVAAVLCAGFVSCGDDDDNEPQNPATENTGGASDNDGSSGNDGDDNGGDGGNTGDGNTPANPETDEYGIAVSHEVDLGLSVNWASWNVGASSPEEYGGYYVWGETEEKSDYDWDTYKWCNGSYDTMTKYCTDSYYGTVDNKTELEPQDDVAHVKWGDGWRMPTEDELVELENNCTWTWITYNGVNGYRVTGKELSNGKRNSIFMPAAGRRRGTSLDGAGSYGYYWGSTLDSGVSTHAYALVFNSVGHDVSNYNRCSGQSVRPVKKNKRVRSAKTAGRLECNLPAVFINGS